MPRALAIAVGVCAASLLATVSSASGRPSAAPSVTVTVTKFGDGSGTVVSEGSNAIDCGRRCRAELPVGTKLVLNATAAQGSRFDVWESACIGSAVTCELRLGAATTVRAGFARGFLPPAGNPLLVTVGGRGIVRSDLPGLIECGSQPASTKCSTLLKGGTLTLRATPAPDWVFVRWSGAPGCGSSATCRVDLDAPRSVAGTFRRRSIPGGTSTLRIRVTGGTPGSVTYGRFVCPAACTQRFANGTIVTLVASGGLSGWSESCVGRAATCVLAISGSESVAADFQTFSATRGAVNVTRSGQGSVESFPPGIRCGSGRDCSAPFEEGQSVRLTATPDQFRVVERWGGRADQCTGTTCSVPALRSGAAVSVLFAVPQDDLRVTKSGDGQGTVTSAPAGIDCGTVCAKRFARGTRVVLRPAASPGSRFAGWPGACSGAGSCPVVLRRSTVVTARFNRIRDELRVTKAGDGDGTVRSTPAGIVCGVVCSAPFPRQSTVELRAVPDGVSRFAGWSGAGTCGAAQVCTVRLDAPTRVRASFERARDELRVVRTGAGFGSVASTPGGIACGERCSGRFLRGAEVLLRATPRPGSRFAGWSGACRGTGECRVTMDGVRRVEARFARICAAASASGFAATVATGPRRVLVSIRLDGAASARLRLFRANRKVAERTITGLGRGLRRLRLDVPRGATRGAYRVGLRVTDPCGGARVFTKVVTVPRRR